MGAKMLATKIFRNGNSQAVRIPAKLAYSVTDMDYQIERIGDELRIRPTPRRIEKALAALKKFTPDFMADGRGLQEQAEREPL
jgi:antitoxin VapB